MKTLKDIIEHWGFVDSEQLKELEKFFPMTPLVIKWGMNPREECLACNVAERIKEVEEETEAEDTAEEEGEDSGAEGEE